MDERHTKGNGTRGAGQVDVVVPPQQPLDSYVDPVVTFPAGGHWHSKGGRRGNGL